MQIAIRFEVNLSGEYRNFNALEVAIVEEVRRVICATLGQVLEKIDAEMGRRLVQIYPQYRFKGYQSRRYRCYFGELQFRMRRYSHAGWGSIYPLKLFLSSSGYSGLLEEAMVSLATDIPYERSSEYLKQLIGVSIPSKTLWYRVQALGAAARVQLAAAVRRHGDNYPQDIHPLQGEGAQPPVYLELDGTMIHSREAGEDRFEVKVGIMHSHVLALDAHKKRLSDKLMYASCDDSFRFGEQYYGFCRAMGLDLKRRLICLGDGAGWLNGVAQEYFPRAIQRLDLYHLKRACGAILEQVEVHTFLNLAQTKSAKRAIEYLQAVCQVKEVEPQVLSGLLQYLSNNQKGLNYPPGERHGSGGVEKSIDILVCRRFKRQGMSWSRTGANNLLVLRTQKLNQRWIQTSQALNYQR